MLHQFTWQQFLVAATVLTGIWYLVVLVVFYRDKLSGRSRVKGDDALPHRWQGKVDELQGDIEEENALMAKPKMPEGMASIIASEVSFGGVDKDEQIGLVPDLLADVRAVFRSIAEKDGHKQDFFEQMVTVRESYPGMGGHPATPEINAYIAEHAPFHLTAEELEDLWD